MLLQLERLEEVFRESKYPDVYRREEIAAQLDIKEEVVRVSIFVSDFRFFNTSLSVTTNNEKLFEAPVIYNLR